MGSRWGVMLRGPEQCGRTVPSCHFQGLITQCAYKIPWIKQAHMKELASLKQIKEVQVYTSNLEFIKSTPILPSWRRMICCTLAWLCIIPTLVCVKFSSKTQTIFKQLWYFTLQFLNEVVGNKLPVNCWHSQ